MGNTVGSGDNHTIQTVEREEVARCVEALGSYGCVSMEGMYVVEEATIEVVRGI